VPARLSQRQGPGVGANHHGYAQTFSSDKGPVGHGRLVEEGITLLYGDCREVLPALSGIAFDLVVTDPPYNCGKSYDTHDGHVPGRSARPVGSVQRAVTADELRNGVHVSLLEMREAASAGQLNAPMVLAWIEVGGPDLEFDGRAARPGPGSVYGMAKRRPAGGVLQISLNRRLLA